MQGSDLFRDDSIDLHLVLRILDTIIDGTRQQMGKRFEPDNSVEAIFSLSSAKELNPPFDKLHSTNSLIRAVTQQKDLFDTKHDGQWTRETIEKMLEELKAQKLIYEIELKKGQYAEASRIIIQPLGLIVYSRLKELYESKEIGRQDFIRRVDECHVEHSYHTLEVFAKRIDLSVRRSQKLTTFNISMAIMLLMYGAVSNGRAFRVEVNPTEESLHLYQVVVSKELRRIGKRILNSDPVNKGTLLDHIQETNKIKRVLDDSKLYRREQKPGHDGKPEYHLYFDVGGDDISNTQTRERLDSVLFAIMSNAAGRSKQAPKAIVSLFNEHVTNVNTTMKPIHMSVLFGSSPTPPYLVDLQAHAESILEQMEDLEEQEIDDE